LSQIPIVSVVDDDESVRLSINSLIRSLGYVGRTFAAAEDFLNATEAQSSDCLIADIQMPGMSGIELQQALLLKGYKLPIIFITAFPEERIRERVFSAGALCLLGKPYDSGELVECIETALARHN
jgi:FixJ family two-component response regulator